jgi:hypothetical protein
MKRFSVAALTVGLMVTAVTVSGSAHAAVMPVKRLVLIVAGQSNATGLGSYARDGKTDYLAAPFATGADRTSTITWDQSYLGTDKEASEVPLDTPQVIEANAPAPYAGLQIFGPEIGLARAVYAATGQPMTIIKVAFENTALAGQWIPGGPLWNTMVSFVQSTIARDAAAGQKDTIGGFYWIQGEDDAAIPAWAALYQVHLNSFVLALRRDLPLGPHPAIVLAKTWDPKSPGNTEVRAADDWVAAHRPNVFTVDTKNLPRLADEPHLTNVGELALGKAMAEVAMP